MKKILVSTVTMLLLLVSCFSVCAAGQRVVKVGAFNYYPGIFKDTDGTVKGFYVDALAEIAQRENIRFEYVYGSWSEGLERIRNGEVDVITSVAFTPERAEFLDFAITPLLTVWGELYVPLSSEIDGIREVKGKKIGVMKGDFNGRNFIDLVKKFDISCEFVEMPGFDDVFKAIAAKKVDAGVVNSTFGVARQKEFNLRSTGVVFNPFDIFFAVAKGKNSDLLELLDNYLNSWRHQEDSPFTSARQKWSHGSNSPIHIIPRWLIISLVILAVLAISAGIFVVLLRKQVRSKTRSAIESAKQFQIISERQKALLAAVPDIIMEVDTNKIYTWANHAGFEFFGDDVIGTAASSYFAGDQNTYELVQPLHDGTENLVYVESWQRRKDGEIRLLAWWCKSLVDENNVVTGTLSTARDITERQQIENVQSYLLQMSSLSPDVDFFELLARYLATTLGMDYVCIDRLHGDCLSAKTLAVYHDGKFEDNVEYTLKDTPCGDVMGKEVCVFPSKVRNLFPRDVALQDLEAESYIGTTLWSSDMKPIGLIAVIGRKQLTESHFAESVLKLVSIRAAGELERRQAEAEKQALEQQFQQTQKLESLGVLAGGIAHDFNNILAIIMGNCSLAKIDNENAGNYIPEIEKASERAAELCRQMLAYAGKSQFVKANINVADLVDEMVRMLQKTIPQNAEITIDCSTDIPMIQGDAGQLSQIVMNLIINASEAIGNDQGHIHVSLARTTVTAEHSARDYIGNPILCGEYVCLDVTDDGCGMDEETKWRIFEPFYTTKFTGRGLGMSAVLGIIMSHKGALQLYSQLGRGTTFKVYLPAHNSGVSDTEQQRQSSSEAPWQGSGTILLVDDEGQIRHIAKTLLEMFGFTVFEAVNGKEALDMYEKHASEIKLVLTDMGMPVMDGYVLFQELKRLDPALPIIISSGFGEADVTSKIGEHDIAGLISKPYTSDTLRDVLKRVVGDTKGNL